MAFSYRRLFFEGNTFCCCLPVRLGVISMSLLGLLIAGLLTVVLWFEVLSSGDLTSSERAAFILAGLTETILFAASILGLIGAIARKQSFTQIYAYILYVHFVLNLGVAAYLLFEITRVTSNAEVLACQTAVQDPQAQDQCSGLLSIARWVYIALAAIVLLVEMYGAIIVTRYLNQVKRDKGMARVMRQDTENAFSLKPSSRGNYARLSSPALLPPVDSSYLSPSDTDFNPYAEAVRPAHSVEGGYGGGLWTHDAIASEEKAKLQRREEAEAALHLNHLDGGAGETINGGIHEEALEVTTLPAYSASHISAQHI